MDKALSNYQNSVIKKKYRNLYELVELVKKDIALFKSDMEEAIPAFNLVNVQWNEVDTILLWDDLKESVYYEEYLKVGRNIDFSKDVVPWGNSSREEATKKYFKDNTSKLKEKYPLYRTSRLVKWYSIFENIVVNQGIYEPTRQDYDWFFTLRGENFRDDSNYQFYTLVNLLCRKQVVEKRKAVVKELLKDERVVERLKANTFVLPARAQFYLSTPQVYDAWLKSMEEKTRYSNRRSKIFARVSNLMKEGYDYSTAMKLAEEELNS